MLATIGAQLARAANNKPASLRIPINSSVYSDLISPRIPISNRSPFRFQIVRGNGRSGRLILWHP
jgi:hypothetical protein